MKIRNLILALLIVLVTQPFNIANAGALYQDLAYLSGTNPDINLQIRKNDLELNLLKSANIRVRVKVNKLYTTNDSTASFKISMYDVSGPTREYISSQSLSLIRGVKGNRVLSMNAGNFTSSNKSLEFDLFDTQNNLVNVYSGTVTATNLAFQASSGAGVTLGASCPAGTFGECQLDELFKRVSFVARRQRHASTRVVKSDNGLYQVTLPVPRQAFKFLAGNRVRAVNLGNVGNGGNTTTIAEVVDSLGIGVSAPVSAFLHVSAGNGIVPSLILNPGALTTNTPPNGSIEFDGNDLFITKNGVRTVVGSGAGTPGAQGPSGPSGPQGATGATGATGPQGPAGTLDSNNGATITGDVDIDGNLDVTGTITAGLIDAPTPSKVGADFDVNGQTSINVSSINYLKLTDSNITTTDEIFTLTGGVTGQQVILHAQNTINVRVDNAGTANAIQWGRGTNPGSTRTLQATEAYEFVYDGNAWFLISRYIL